jgi:hypothetical protein
LAETALPGSEACNKYSTLKVQACNRIDVKAACGIYFIFTAARLEQYSELEFLNNLWGARNRIGIGLSCRPARLYRLAEFIPWNLFLGSINV